MHVYEVRPRKDKCGANLISGVVPFGRMCTPNRTRLVTQSDTRSIAADQRML